MQDQREILAEVNRTVMSELEEFVSQAVKRSLEAIQPEINRMVAESIRSHIDQQTRIAVKTAVAQTNVNSIVKDAVIEDLHYKVDRFQFPDNTIPHSSIDWSNFMISGNQVVGGLIKQFNSTGIQDDATECQLTIVDGAVVVEKGLVVNNISAKNIEVDNLTVKGQMLLNDDVKQQISEYSTAVAASVFADNIDIGSHSIVSGDAMLLSHNTLGPSVMHSNIRRLGLLQELHVSGTADFGDTMFINMNKVGINTDNPAGVLTIWDDDAELTIAKQARGRMFIGSTRGNELSLGTAKDDQVRISKNEVAFNSALRIMGVRFSVADRVPDRNGEAGEIVMVTSAVQGQPMFYQCQGHNTWAAMSVSV